MSKGSGYLLQGALLALAAALAGLVLGVTIVAQREGRLEGRLHAWPAADAGYEAFLRPAEEGRTPLTLLVFKEEPGGAYLVAVLEGRMWVMPLPPEMRLEEGGELKTVEELRGAGLPHLVGSLTGACSLPVERCVSLAGGELAGLRERAARTGGEAGPGGDCRAGSCLAGFGALWRELFTPRDLVMRRSLQSDLAAATRVDPGIGYRALQDWGAALSGVDEVITLQPPTAGWHEDSRDLDGPACASIFDLLPRGEEALQAWLADYQYGKEAERRIRDLSYGPVEPAIVYGGNADRMEVAITLDDGFNMDWRIVELLDSYGIDCTVFLIGRGVADRHPEWMQAMDALGWEVANHTYTHPIARPHRLIEVPDEAVWGELKAAQQIISDATGKKYPYFRPPGGWVDERVAALAADLGYITVMWSLDSGDAVNPNVSPMDRARTMLEKVKPGHILLFHFGGYGTYETLKYLVPELLARGYHPVTLTRLFQP